jgi:hypothetical protein
VCHYWVHLNVIQSGLKVGYVKRKNVIVHFLAKKSNPDCENCHSSNLFWIFVCYNLWLNVWNKYEWIQRVVLSREKKAVMSTNQDWWSETIITFLYVWSSNFMVLSSHRSPIVDSASSNLPLCSAAHLACALRLGDFRVVEKLYLWKYLPIQLFR